MCAFKNFPGARIWTPGVVGFTEASVMGISGVNWGLKRIEAGYEKKYMTGVLFQFMLGWFLYLIYQG